MVVFTAVQTVALVMWMTIGRRQWFFRDEWDFLAARKAGDLGDLFRPHNEHWTTIPILVYRFLYSIFGLRAYFPYRLVGVVTYLTVAGLLFVIMRRALVNPWIACAAASLFSLFAPGSQNVQPFQITFTGALAFGLAQLLLADHDGAFETRDRVGLCFGVLALMTSGVAVPLIFAVGLAVLLRRGARPALLHVAPLAVVYAMWWIVIGRSGGITAPVGWTPGDHGIGGGLSFVWAGLRATSSAIGPIAGLGAVLPIVLVVGLVCAWLQRRNAMRLGELAVPIALAAGAISFLTVTSLGRAFLGPNGASRSRYISVVAAMTLPALAVAVDALTARRRFLLPFGLAVFLAGISPTLLTLIRQQPPATQDGAPSRSLILTLPRDPLALQAPRSLQPDTVLARGVTVGWLLDAAREHRIPAPTSSSPLDASTNEFRLSFNRVVGEKPDTYCRIVRQPLTVELEAGDEMGVSEGPILIGPEHRETLEGTRLQFLARDDERVEVLRDAGVVQIAEASPPLRPRVCFSRPVLALHRRNRSTPAAP